jgi:hypothetical protein
VKNAFFVLSLQLVCMSSTFTQSAAVAEKSPPQPAVTLAVAPVTSTSPTQKVKNRVAGSIGNTFTITLTSPRPIFLATLEIAAQGTGLSGKAHLSGTAEQHEKRMVPNDGGYSRVLFFIGTTLPAGTATYVVTLPGDCWYVSLDFPNAVLWSPTKDDLVNAATTYGVTLGTSRRYPAKKPRRR